MTRPHFPAVDPDTKLPSAAVQAAWANITSIASKVDKGAVTFNVRDYGAVGNWSSGTTGTDDTAAINACLTAANAAASANSPARVLVPWTSGNGYKFTSGIVTPANVEWDMRADLVYCGSGGETALTIGSSTAEFRRKHRIMLRRHALSDWTSEADAGILIRNQYAGEFHVVKSDFFTVGLTCMGDNTNGFSYNAVRIGQLGDNKIALDLTNDTSGWCNENDFYGGRITCSTSTYTSLDRVGVRITSRATTKYYNNSNVFHKPSFELKGAAIAGNSRCALIEYGTANAFIKARHEGNSPEVIEQLNNSRSTEMSFAYSDLGSGTPVVVSTSSSAARVRMQYNMMAEDAMRVVRKVDAIHKRACYYDGSTSVNLPGLTVGTSATGDTDARAASSLVLAADYLEIPSSRYAGFYMSTRILKRFALLLDAEAGLGGRALIRCYDSGGSQVSAAGTCVTTNPTANPTYTTAYGGGWRTGGDTSDPRDYQVSSGVDYVFVGVTGGTAAARIRSMTVATLDPVDSATWLRHDDNGENYATTTPTAGTWAVGRKLWNAAPASGQPAFWVCTTAGTPGTWLAVT